jgi:hypothetical protein
VECLEARALPGFLSAGTFPVGNNPHALTVGDFNGDGKLDVAVTSSDFNNVSVFLGDGTGHFRFTFSAPVGKDPTAVVAADFNGDGKADLAVANFHDNTVSVLRGLGNGSFAIGPGIPVGLSPTALAVGDFNGDGIPDLAVAGSGPAVSILLGHGNGTLSAPTSFLPGLGAVAVAAGDFNDDGKTDLALADPFDHRVLVLLGDGTGRFTAAPPLALAAASDPVSLAVADLNGDGRADLAVADNGTGAVDVFLGHGDGTFAAPVPYPAGPNPEFVVAADFNGDGHPDLAVVNQSAGTASVLLGRGDGSFAPPAAIPVGSDPLALAVGDLDGNDSSDLAVVNTVDNTVTVLLNQDPGPATHFAVQAPATAQPGQPIPFTVIALNARGRIAAGYRGAVAFASTDPAAGLPGPYTFTAADAGRHTFTVALNNPGTWSLVAEDVAAPALADGVAVTVQSPPAPPTAVTDITGQLRIIRGRLLKHGKRVRQTVTLTDVGGTRLEGPVWLVFNPLPRRVRVSPAAGLTQYHAPLLSPSVLATAGGLGPGQSVTVTLGFGGRLPRRLGYAVRVLAGSGTL